MASRQIKWTVKANLERRDILSYWIDRNKSKAYSLRLNEMFTQALNGLAENPLTGRRTDYDNVRVKIVRDYLLFYEYDNIQIKVLSIWDARRDEKNIVI